MSEAETDLEAFAGQPPVDPALIMEIPTTDREERKSFGEDAGLGDDFSRRILRSIVGQAQGFRRGARGGHDVGLRLYKEHGGPIIWDGMLDDYSFEREDPEDDSITVRLKNPAPEVPDNHPLRNGIVLTAGGLLLVGGGLYIRHKHKK